MLRSKGLASGPCGYRSHGVVIMVAASLTFLPVLSFLCTKKKHMFEVSFWREGSFSQGWAAFMLD